MNIYANKCEIHNIYSITEGNFLYFPGYATAQYAHAHYFRGPGNDSSIQYCNLLCHWTIISITPHVMRINGVTAWFK